jgi:hypothetical protein
LLPFEEANRESYVLLQRIEVFLREATSRALADEFGPTWHRVLPGPLLLQVREAQRDETKRKQYGFLKLSALHYLTLGELLTFLKSGNARNAANTVGGINLIELIEKVLPVRNAICHCRSTDQSGHLLVKSVYLQVVSAVGSSHFEALIKDPTTGIWPEDAMAVIDSWLAQVKEGIIQLSSKLPRLTELAPTLQDQFWLDDQDSIGVDRSQLRTLDRAIEKYNQVQGVGSAAIRGQIAVDEQLALQCDLYRTALKKC